MVWLWICYMESDEDVFVAQQDGMNTYLSFSQLLTKP